MNWMRSHRADPRAVKLADRHYNRQKVGSPQFVPPGGCAVFVTPSYGALWVTSTPKAEYVKHAWAGAWVNSLFRNESREVLSSQLITEAVSASVYVLGSPPSLGIVSFIDDTKTRRKRDVGRCYRRAGWKHVGFTKGGLWAFLLSPDSFPPPVPPLERFQ